MNPASHLTLTDALASLAAPRPGPTLPGKSAERFPEHPHPSWKVSGMAELDEALSLMADDHGRLMELTDENMLRCLMENDVWAVTALIHRVPIETTDPAGPSMTTR